MVTQYITIIQIFGSGHVPYLHRIEWGQKMPSKKMVSKELGRRRAKEPECTISLIAHVKEEYAAEIDAEYIREEMKFKI